MVLRQYIDTLGRGGITKVPAVGSQFDPTHHEAIQQVESDEPPGTIVAEVQPGYMQGDRLIRAAMVVVAKPKSEKAGDESAGGEAE
jgi:molecular chaperone GrpE